MVVVRWSTAVLALAALTLLIPAAPDYDAWAYLTWGREVAHLDLSTDDGPAFKPLPVAICALLSPLGDAAPEAWLVVVRAGAIAAVLLALSLGRRGVTPLSAAVALLLTGGFVRYAAGGDAEPLLVALALGAWTRHRAGRRDQALVLATLAALVRVETWPFVAAYAVAVLGWRRALPLGAAIAALWFGPELAGSGDLLRSAERASIPNPGAPAEADVPFLASLGDAAGLLPLPLVLGALLATRDARVAVAGGAAWCLLVAVMAELGFSGEARYAMPGAALIAVGAALALRRLPPALVGLLVAATVAVNWSDFDGLRSTLAYRADLVADLNGAIEDAGGRDRLLGCGRPAVGRYRGTMTAYALEVEKKRVRADGRPDAVTLRSRLGPRDPVEPPRPAGARLLAANGLWRIEARCVSGAR